MDGNENQTKSRRGFNMNLNRKCYYRALVGTFLIIVLIGLGITLLVSQKVFSFSWFIGAMNIICIYVILLYVNYKFIFYNERRVN